MHTLLILIMCGILFSFYLFYFLKQVIDLKAIAQLKEKDSSHLAKDPLDDASVRAKFISEVEKYEKLVDGLVRKSLNGTTPLDQKWKVNF